VEKKQIIIAEIILYSTRLRCNHRLRKREIFKDACRRIDFSENIAVIRNDSEVTIPNCFNDLIHITAAEIVDIPVEPALLGRFHYFFKECGPFATNFEPRMWNVLCDSLQ